jgi:hypothetical protein
MVGPKLRNIAVWGLLVASFVGAAAFHPPPFHEQPVVDAIEARGAFCNDLLAEHPYPEAVARWCPVVVFYFGEEWGHWAMHVLACESAGKPTARNGTHYGLYQQKLKYWPRRSRLAGWEGHEPTNPEANIAVSAWLFNDGRGKSHWSCTANK